MVCAAARDEAHAQWERAEKAEAAAAASAKDAGRLDWLEREHTLHTSVEILYVVDGYDIDVIERDCTVVSTAHGDTLRTALDAAIAQQETRK